MIGIYMWKNKINNKVYVGQSSNIAKRKAEHLRNNQKEEYDTVLSRAFKKYGEENFEFIILEKLSSPELLDKREKYWMEKYKSLSGEFGYNMLDVGEIPSSLGENNPRAQVTEEDVIDIRTRIHINSESVMSVYQIYKDRVSYSAFQKIYSGATWSHITEVPIKPIQIQSKKGKPKAKLTEEDVLDIRIRFDAGESISNIFSDYDHRVSRVTIRRVANRQTWKGIEPVSTISEA